MKNQVKFIVGSEGSYTACNDRALGSKWLDVDDFENWEDVLKELEAEGFKLGGIDEELFLQDVDGIPAHSYFEGLSPREFFEAIKESDILNDGYLFEEFEAFCEADGFLDFVERVQRKGNNWTDDIFYYPGMTLEEVAEEMINECYDLEKMGDLARYIDYEAYARDLSYDYTETENGVIAIY